MLLGCLRKDTTTVVLASRTFRAAEPSPTYPEVAIFRDFFFVTHSTRPWLVTCFSEEAVMGVVFFGYVSRIPKRYRGIYGTAD